MIILKRVSLVFFLTSFFIAISLSPASGQQKSSVLLLNSYHKGLRWTDSVTEGVISTLRAGIPSIDLHIEYMDTKRVSDDGYFAKLYELYAYKYRNIKFDAIISSDDDAFNFLLAYHDSLFPDTPVVFCGVNYFRDSTIADRRDMFTGVVEAFDIRKTLETALRLHPGAAKVIVINDRTTTGVANKQLIEDLIPEFSQRADFSYLEDFDMTDLQKCISELPPDSIILLMTFNRDASGNIFDYDESLSRISGSSKVPIYGVWDFFLGRGIVGGMLTSGYDQGKTAAEAALRIMKGEAVGHIPVVKESPNRYMFDYEQLKRYHIKPAELPEGSEIINRPAPFYATHKKIILWGASGLTGLSLITVVLLINTIKRRRAERDLKTALARAEEEKAKTEAIIAAIGDGITIIDPEFRILYQNEVDRDFFGDHVGERCYEAFGHIKKICRDCPVRKSFEDGSIHRSERKVLTEKGMVFFEITTSPLRDKDGDIIAGIEVLRDITERKAMESSLFRRLEIEKLVSGISSKFINITPEELDGGINWALRKMGEFSGVDRSYVFLLQAGGQKMDNTHEWCREGIAPQICNLQGLSSSDLPWWMERLNSFETIHIPLVADLPQEADEERRILEAQDIRSLIVVPMVYGTRLVGFLGFDSVGQEKKWLQEDISMLKMVAEILVNAIMHRKTGEFINTILETVDEGFLVIDRDYRIISANRSYLESVNMSAEDVIGKPCYEISHKIFSPCCETGEDCPVRRTFDSSHPHSALHTHFDKDGEPVYVEIKSYPVKDESGKVITVIELINNVTEQKKLESQLQQAQKMEAVGQLAGGVAHDFNNILSAILGYGHLLQTKMNEDDPLRVNVEQILDAAERAADVTHSLLAFSRKQMISLKPVDINDLIKKVEKFLSRVIGEDIELRTSIDGGEMTVMADGGQIEQVLVNLATNARDAMPGGGILSICSELIRLDESFIKEHGYGAPGKYVRVSVSDTGAGMDEKTKEKIFEPFFTTKELGRGTGLGLAMVYGIVKQHDGYIHVESKPGEGATFRVYLPSIKTAVAKDRPVTGTSPPSAGTETILVAEDDPALRKLSEVVLKEHGYSVIAAKDGDDTVKKFIENEENIQLVILDVIMPKKNGREAYEEIKRIKPDIKALFVSGYTADVIHKKGIIDEEMDFILKPVSPRDLLRRVREILDR